MTVMLELVGGERRRAALKSPLILEWRTHQQAQSLSVRTVEERTRSVTMMAYWCDVAPEAATVDDIAAWLAEGGEWTATTRWTYHAALAAWFTWLQLRDYRVDNPMDRIGKPRRPRAEPRPLADGNMRRLLSSRMRPNTRAMVLLAAMQGLRVHEIAKIRGEHFDLEARTLVVSGKGGVVATLPLHQLVVEHAVLMPRKGFWFPGTDRGHLKRESVSNAIRDAMRRVRIQGSAHQLRHWFGTALVRAGVDLRTVQVLMRHSNLTSTAIYTLVADEQRTEGIARLDPFGIGRMRPVVSADELRRKAAELLAAADRMDES